MKLIKELKLLQEKKEIINNELNKMNIHGYNNTTISIHTNYKYSYDYEIDKELTSILNVDRGLFIYYLEEELRVINDKIIIKIEELSKRGIDK